MTFTDGTEIMATSTAMVLTDNDYKYTNSVMNICYTPHGKSCATELVNIGLEIGTASTLYTSRKISLC